MTNKPHEGWELVQQQAFTSWFNQHLATRAYRPIVDILTELEDGVALYQLISILKGVPTPEDVPLLSRRKPSITTDETTISDGAVRSEGGNNIDREKETSVTQPARGTTRKVDRVVLLDACTGALDYVEKAGVTLTFVNPTQLVDHDRRMVLGLSWSIITHFQIRCIAVSNKPVILDDEGEVVEENEEDLTRGKAGLLLWVNQESGKNVNNFSKALKDGTVMLALASNLVSKLIGDVDVEGDIDGDVARMDKALSLAEEHFGVTPLVSGSDMVAYHDAHVNATYLAQLYHATQRLEEDKSKRERKERRERRKRRKEMKAQKKKEKEEKQRRREKKEQKKAEAAAAAAAAAETAAKEKDEREREAAIHAAEREKEEEMEAARLAAEEEKDREMARFLSLPTPGERQAKKKKIDEEEREKKRLLQQEREREEAEAAKKEEEELIKIGPGKKIIPEYKTESVCCTACGQFHLLEVGTKFFTCGECHTYQRAKQARNAGGSFCMQIM